MPLTIDQFTQQLSSSGLMTEDELRTWLKSESFEQLPQDGEQLARELVKRKKLTKFQASQIYAGKGASLVLGNYVILDKLGQGGMGMVLKAEHKRMKRLVAVKVISAAAMKSKDAVQRFHREVEAAAKLTHSNIVSAHDADEAKGTHFLVMEYVEGDDLSALVKKGGPLSVNAALDAILQAARGLEYAHKRGVIHRDIKPANLLLDHDGTVKILDMGLARIESSELGAQQAELTNTGAIMGTIDYMSPEQAEDTKHADARSDIYSLGCSLYYLLVGHAVYTADTMMKKLLAHRTAPLPSLVADAASVRTDASSVGHALDAVFHKMIAKKASDRYQSMTEVVAALEQSRAGNTKTTTQSSDGDQGSSNELQRFLREMTNDDPDATIFEPVVAVASLPKRTRTTTTEPTAEETMNSAAGESRTELQARRLGLCPDPNQKVGTESQPTRRAIAIGLACVVLFLAGVIFYVQTNRGTLRIEITDPQIEVAIQGTDIVVKDEGQEDVRLKPGEHILHVKRGNLEFDTDPFTLKKGETIAVKVERIGRRVRAMHDNKLLGHREEPKSKTTSTATGWHGWPTDAPKPAIAPFDAEQAKQHQEAWAKYLNVPVEYTNTIGMKFRLIPPGEFMMGSTLAEIEEALKFIVSNHEHWEAVKSEAPQRKVILTQSFYLGIHEVTQADYEKVMGHNSSHFVPMGQGKDRIAGIDSTASHPVEQVSWNDGADFCAKLSEQEKLKPFYVRAGETITPLDGMGYRFPTEAEWEFACRSGTTTKYWVGDKDEDLAHAGWFGGSSLLRTHAAGELKANPFGLFDVHGNVWEWVQDGWEPNYYRQFQEKHAIDPTSTTSTRSQRVIRGGDWLNPASFCRSSDRDVGAPTRRDAVIGFRVSLPVDAVRQVLKVTGPGVPKSSVTTESDIATATSWHDWPVDAPKPAIVPFDAEQATQHQEAWAKYLNVPVEYTNSIGMKFRLIPPGEFMMGNGYFGPQHKVVLTRPFYVGVHEVSQRFYALVMGENPSSFRSMENKADALDHPVENVSWNQTNEFCNKLNLQNPQSYRLLSEAEWEFVCRAGTITTYHSGNEESDLRRVGWCGKNAEGKTHSVGELRANAFGVHDMHGNVWELCRDRFKHPYEAKPEEIDPAGPAQGDTRLIRGGSWESSPLSWTTAARGSFAQESTGKDVGFRVSLTVDAVRQALTGSAIPGSTGVGAKLSVAEWLTSPDYEWTEPQDLGPVINFTPYNYGPRVSNDGLEMWFVGNLVNADARSKGQDDLWISRRKSLRHRWEEPTNVGDPFNTPGIEKEFSWTGDERTIFFKSQTRDGISFSTRTGRDQPWSAPQAIPGLNAGAEFPVVSADGLTLFVSLPSEAGGLGGRDIGVVTRKSANDPWSSPSVLLEPLNSPAEDWPCWLSADRTTILLSSNREGGMGDYDLWLATRSTDGTKWQTPVNLGRGINTEKGEYSSHISFDSQTLSFTRGGQYPYQKIWQSRRVPKKGTAAASPSELVHDVTGDTLPPGQWYDVMKLVDVERHALDSKWKRTSDGIARVSGRHAQMVVPVQVQGSYELAFAFTRLGDDHDVVLHLPVGEDTSCALLLSGGHGEVSALQLVDNIDTSNQQNSPAVHRPGTLQNLRRYQGRAQVTLNGDEAQIEVELEDLHYLHWQGKRTRLKTHHWTVLPRTDLLGFGSQVPVVFHELRLKPLTKVERVWNSDRSTFAVVPEPKMKRTCVQWNGHWYALSDTRMEFREAVALAQQHRARLLQVSSRAEHDFIRAQWPKRDIWLGLWRNGQQVNPQWSWVDQQLRPQPFFNWKPGQPSAEWGKSFSAITGDDGLWEDIDTWEQTHFVCLEWGEDKIPKDASAARISNAPAKLPAIWPKSGRVVPTEKQKLQRDTWYDLLPLVDVDRHAINGSWLRSADGLHGFPCVDSRVVVPLVVNGDYELAVSFTRYAGNEAIHLILPIGPDAQTELVLSGWAGQFSGILNVGGADTSKQPRSLAVRTPAPLENFRRNHATVRVSSKEAAATIEVRLNGEPYFTWTGPRRDLTNTPMAIASDPPRRDLLAIGLYDVPVTYHELRLKLLTGTAQQWSADMPSAAAQPPESIAAQCVNWKETGKPYWISPKPMNFTEALQLAHRHQARLLRVSSPAEREFLLKTWPDRRIWLAAWRNGSEPDPRIGWLDEKLRPLRFFPPWAEQEPSNFSREFSLQLLEQSHQMRDVYSSDAIHAVLEWGEEE